jgi:hypothetical protein
MTGEVGLHLATVLSGLSAGMQIFVCGWPRCRYTCPRCLRAVARGKWTLPSPLP